ncbi:MAG: arginine--tRNA ligase [Planctomycetaceae bacterium]|nr:arginine--tRNA ligase [Planctomycetaceae bacterium]
MNVLARLRRQMLVALREIAPEAEVAPLAEMVTTAQDARFGDYQANCAMPLGKLLKRPPRDVAAELVAKLDTQGMCHPAEIAGPGFINLKLNDAWLTAQLQAAVADPRLTVTPVEQPRTYVIDYSAPNVAKPMHVGHIRSTVIGDALYRVLKFIGHRVISDNHLGDWGTQFGMIIYGYKHFRDESAYQDKPVDELSRLYRLVHRIIAYYEGRDELPILETKVAAAKEACEKLDRVASDKLDKDALKKLDKDKKRAQDNAASVAGEWNALQSKLAAEEADAAFIDLARKHATIQTAVLTETAKLHAGDAENHRLWQEFMPPCLSAIEEVYRRLGVTFDVTLGESFYHPRLAEVVDDLAKRGLARESDGALCVFLEKFAAPMIVRKKDGAFLYATTDLATIRYRMQTWQPDAILYVVDHRQSFHFEQLFALAQIWDCAGVELRHISFGTVLGKDGKPYKTRSGDTVGLTGLLDEAVSRARKIVDDAEKGAPRGQELNHEARAHIAEVVGISAIKYADLTHDRNSDYEFSYDKMLAMYGNTATYMQYAYARVRSIFRRGEIDVDALRQSGAKLVLVEPAERALARQLLRLEEALEQTVADYRPNMLTAYLFDLADAYSTFFEQCPVLKADSPTTRDSRLLLCDLTARTIRQGLELLGIPVVEQM